MARKAQPVAAPETLLPHDWRNGMAWETAAMLAKIPQADYLPEIRAFESHHIGNQTLSDDWYREWKAWCRRRLIEGGAPAQIEQKRERPRLFG